MGPGYASAPESPKFRRRSRSTRVLDGFLYEVEELARPQEFVRAHRVEAVEVAHEMPGIRGVAGDQVVVRRHDQTEVQRLGELRRLAEVRVAYDAPGRPEIVAAVDGYEGHVYRPG